MAALVVVPAISNPVAIRREFCLSDGLGCTGYVTNLYKKKKQNKTKQKGIRVILASYRKRS